MERNKVVFQWSCLQEGMVVGLDISPGEVRHATAMAESRGVANVKVAAFDLFSGAHPLLKCLVCGGRHGEDALAGFYI